MSTPRKVPIPDREAASIQKLIEEALERMVKVEEYFFMLTLRNDPIELQDQKTHIEEQFKEFSEFLQGIEAVMEESKHAVFAIYANIINQYCKTLPTNDSSDHVESFEQKKHNVKFINGTLRKVDAAIAHPQTNEPCILYAVASYDQKGRYTLESRITNKRSWRMRSLAKMSPFQLVPDLPRKEGFIESRKIKG